MLNQSLPSFSYLRSEDLPSQQLPVRPAPAKDLARRHLGGGGAELGARPRARRQASQRRGPGADRPRRRAAVAAAQRLVEAAGSVGTSSGRRDGQQPGVAPHVVPLDGAGGGEAPRGRAAAAAAAARGDDKVPPRNERPPSAVGLGRGGGGGGGGGGHVGRVGVGGRIVLPAAAGAVCPPGGGGDDGHLALLVGGPVLPPKGGRGASGAGNGRCHRHYALALEAGRHLSHKLVDDLRLAP